MKSNMLVLVLAITLFSCSAENDTPISTRVFNADVASSLNNFKQSFNSKRAELEFISGIKVNSCDTYSKEVENSKISEGVNNQIAKSEYLLCDVLGLLGNKSYSVKKADVNISNLIASKLDLRSFPSSLGPRIDDKSHTIKSIAGNDLAVKANAAIYETPDWNFKLELVAISDINANKKEDWILWVTDESKSGNYRSYQTLVLYDVDTSKNLMVDQRY